MFSKYNLPIFPYYRNPIDSTSLRESQAECDCCGQSRGVMFNGVIYSKNPPKNICPWCIADGSAVTKYDCDFFDAYFVDSNMNIVDVPQKYFTEVFAKTIVFLTFNPIGWWVHCGQPAEYIEREEPHDLVFECKVCGERHVIRDLDQISNELFERYSQQLVLSTQ